MAGELPVGIERPSDILRDPETGEMPAWWFEKRTKEWWDAHPEAKEVARLAGGMGRGNAYGATGQVAYEVAAAMAAVHADALADELIDMALHGEKASERLAAIKQLYDMEHRVRQERRDELDQWARLAGEELNDELADALRGALGIERPPRVDAEGSLASEET